MGGNNTTGDTSNGVPAERDNAAETNGTAKVKEELTASTEAAPEGPAKKPVPFEVKAEPMEIDAATVAGDTTSSADPKVAVKSEGENAESFLAEIKTEPEGAEGPNKEGAAEESAEAMDTSLDDTGGHLTDMKPPSQAAGAAPGGGFVINISSNKQPPMEGRESVMSTASDDSTVAPSCAPTNPAQSTNGTSDKGGSKEEPAAPVSEFDPDAIIQGPNDDPDETKPRFKRAKLTAYPPMNKDKELSSLCTIM